MLNSLKSTALVAEPSECSTTFVGQLIPPSLGSQCGIHAMSRTFLDILLQLPIAHGHASISLYNNGPATSLIHSHRLHKDNGCQGRHTECAAVIRHRSLSGDCVTGGSLQGMHLHCSTCVLKLN